MTAEKAWVAVLLKEGRWSIGAVLPAATSKRDAERAAKNLATERKAHVVLVFGPEASVQAHCDRMNAQAFHA